MSTATHGNHGDQNDQDSSQARKGERIREVNT